MVYIRNLLLVYWHYKKLCAWTLMVTKLRKCFPIFTFSVCQIHPGHYSPVIKPIFIFILLREINDIANDFQPFFIG